MSEEPGKYDSLCSKVREWTKSEGAVLIVINGSEGSGFSIQLTNSLMFPAIADTLVEVARQIQEKYGSKPEEPELY